LAIYSLSITPTAGAAEGDWSLHGYLHSKARNWLTNPRVQKLVYVFQNLRFRDLITTSTPSCFAEEEVEEADDELDDGNEPTEGSLVVVVRAADLSEHSLSEID
jgi:hypothetical protein